jgi:hypothetical protein
MDMRWLMNRYYFVCPARVGNENGVVEDSLEDPLTYVETQRGYKAE